MALVDGMNIHSYGRLIQAMLITQQGKPATHSFIPTVCMAAMQPGRLPPPHCRAPPQSTAGPYKSLYHQRARYGLVLEPA